MAAGRAAIPRGMTLKPGKNVLGKAQAEVKEKLKQDIEACRALDVPRFGTYNGGGVAEHLV